MSQYCVLIMVVWIMLKDLSAGGMSHMLPTSLVHLIYLYLEVYRDVEDEVSSALCLMRNSPNLEKIVLTVNDAIRYIKIVFL